MQPDKLSPDMPFVSGAAASSRVAPSVNTFLAGPVIVKFAQRNRHILRLPELADERGVSGACHIKKAAMSDAKNIRRTIGISKKDSRNTSELVIVLNVLIRGPHNALGKTGLK